MSTHPVSQLASAPVAGRPFLARRIWNLLGFGPHNRPYIPRTWAHLVSMAMLAGVVLADGVLTALNVTSTSHPFVAEANLIPALTIARLGVAGLLLIKIFQAAFLLATFDYLRHRGYLLSPFVLAFIGIVFYSLVDLYSLTILLSPPTVIGLG